MHIFTATDQAWGDRAVYDIDQAVLVLTGKDLRLVTPQDTMTARDSMEYWSQQHMAVGRGDAVVTTSDGRRLSGDVLVGYTTPGDQGSPAKPAKPAPAAKPGAAPDPLAASGKLQRVDAFGHVEVRTATEIVRGDRGVYVPDTGIARLAGNVRITRGDNQLNGNEAEVDLKTGIARLIATPGPPGAGPRRAEHRFRRAGAGDRATREPEGARGGAAESQGQPSDRRPPVNDIPRSGTEALRVLEGKGGLVAQGVGKTYKKRPVVRNVTISVRRGEAVGLLGPNGAGKTTTFYMIVGLVRPDTGAIRLDGADITGLPMYRRARLGIGYLPQEASVFRGLNVEQNIMAALEVVEPDQDRRDMMLDELLAEFGISHLRRTPALALSGGERRRVEIARALATQPALHPARRAARRHRPDRGGRDPRSRLPPEGSRHRRADHRSQRARNAGDHRPGLHHA